MRRDSCRSAPIRGRVRANSPGVQAGVGTGSPLPAKEDPPASGSPLLAKEGVGGGSTGLPLLVLIGAQLAVGAAAILARAGLVAGLSPIALAAWRLTLAASIVLAVRRRGPKSAPSLPARDRWALSAAGLLLSVHFVAWFVSLQLVSVARSTLLVTTAPLWAGLGTVLLGRRLPARFWAGVCLAVLGGWLVTSHGSGSIPVETGAGPLTVFGDAAAILGAMAIAGYLLLTERRQTTLGTGVVVSWTYTSAALLTWLVIPLLHPGGVWPRDAAAWLSVAGMALVPQLIGHTALNWCLRAFPASVVSAATLLEPVFAGALAWALLHEPLTGWQLAGAAILLAGVALSLWKTTASVPTEPKRQEGAAV